MLRIDNDLGRFRDIVKGRVRRELRRFMSSGELLGRQGGKTVSIPLPKIGIPRLRYGDNEGQGVGQGEGPGQGSEAGEEPGEHVLEVELTVDELAELLGEELELPRIEPKGSQAGRHVEERLQGHRLAGPREPPPREADLPPTRSSRTIASGTYNPRKPVIVPIKDDRRYRAFVPETEPRSAAVILYMMDVSGSMGDQQKEIVRSTGFWIDLWIRQTTTRMSTPGSSSTMPPPSEVDRDTFFRTRESGGTLISSAYKLAVQILERDYPVSDWNIYPFHFSDGDNWSQADTKSCLELLRTKLLPWSNQFSYAQVDSQYGSGQFIKDLTGAFDDEALVCTRIPDKDRHHGRRFKELLGRGR